MDMCLGTLAEKKNRILSHTSADLLHRQAICHAQLEFTNSATQFFP